MNIGRIRECLDKITETRVIGKDFSIGGTDFHFVGFYRTESELHAVVLSYNEELFERKEQAEIDALNKFDLDRAYQPTVRESERMELMIHEPVLHIKSLNFAGTVLESRESHMTLLDNGIEESIILLSEFVRTGWKSKRFECISFYNLYLKDIIFTGEFDSIPDISENITLSFALNSVRRLAEIPVLLEIGAEEKEIELPSGDKIYLRETKLMDMYEEMEQFFCSERFRELCPPEEIEKQRKNFIENFSPCCPKGKYFIGVEYEAAENISVDVKPKSVLDAPPVTKEGCMAFIIRSDKAPLREKMKVKTTVIDIPFDGSTKTVDAEIFTFSEMLQPDDITI